LLGSGGKAGCSLSPAAACWFSLMQLVERGSCSQQGGSSGDQDPSSRKAEWKSGKGHRTCKLQLVEDLGKGRRGVVAAAAAGNSSGGRVAGEEVGVVESQSRRTGPLVVGS
jgi:hypothetical protein